MAIAKGGKNMSQRLDRYRVSVWELLESMPASCVEHSHELSHYSKDGRTYFKINFALAMYGYNYELTIAVDKITAKAEIVNEDGKDITERFRQLFRSRAVDEGYLSA